MIVMGIVVFKLVVAPISSLIKSAEQATEIGILEESQYEEYVNMKMQEFQEKKSAKEIVEKSKELIAMGSIMRDLDIKRNSDWYRKYNSASDFMGNASKECVAYVDENMNILKKYSKEEAEYIRLVHDMQDAIGTVMYDELAAKETQMLEAHPELAEMKLKDENGNLEPSVEEFMNAEKNAMIGKMLNNFTNINNTKDIKPIIEESIALIPIYVPTIL